VGTTICFALWNSEPTAEELLLQQQTALTNELGLREQDLIEPKFHQVWYSLYWCGQKQLFVKTFTSSDGSTLVQHCNSDMGYIRTLSFRGSQGIEGTAILKVNYKRVLLV
jgi:hypothetical protein